MGTFAIDEYRSHILRIVFRPAPISPCTLTSPAHLCAATQSQCPSMNFWLSVGALQSGRGKGHGVSPIATPWYSIPGILGCPNRGLLSSISVLNPAISVVTEDLSTLARRNAIDFSVLCDLCVKQGSVGLHCTSVSGGKAPSKATTT